MQSCSNKILIAFFGILLIVVISSGYLLMVKGKQVDFLSKKNDQYQSMLEISKESQTDIRGKLQRLRAKNQELAIHLDLLQQELINCRSNNQLEHER